MDTRTRHKDCTVRIRPECRDVFRGQRVCAPRCIVELLIGMSEVRLGHTYTWQTVWMVAYCSLFHSHQSARGKWRVGLARVKLKDYRFILFHIVIISRFFELGGQSCFCSVSLPWTKWAHDAAGLLASNTLFALTGFMWSGSIGHKVSPQTHCRGYSTPSTEHVSPQCKTLALQWQTCWYLVLRWKGYSIPVPESGRIW